ncbi:hypothetical protein BDV30DRAFT_30044 [Aspergillus minisclerotigenes]|uniref:Uncharacterized protein n=1 Tax=Aspergillus minisclerotigenes TaxID=656917 RepID=A0A5N6IMT1_9EURO|nr:hypothetical protein BDV30DRAFT_30044 [Aspergillus minisclerotigenes]
MQPQRLELELPPLLAARVLMSICAFYTIISRIIIIFFYKANRYTEPWGYPS